MFSKNISKLKISKKNIIKDNESANNFDAYSQWVDIYILSFFFFCHFRLSFFLLLFSRCKTKHGFYLYILFSVLLDGLQREKHKIKTLRIVHSKFGWNWFNSVSGDDLWSCNWHHNDSRHQVMAIAHSPMVLWTRWAKKK